MFFAIFLIIFIFAVAIFILVFVAMFLVHRWTANRLIDKMTEKAVDAIPRKQIDFKA